MKVFKFAFQYLTICHPLTLVTLIIYFKIPVVFMICIYVVLILRISFSRMSQS